MEVDFLTRKELNGYKGDLKASQYALEAEKASFEKKMINIYGPQMINELNKKPEVKKEKTAKRKRCWLFNIFNKKGD